MKPRLQYWIFKTLLIIVLVYLGLGIYLYIFQTRYIYFPNLPTPQNFYICEHFPKTKMIDHNGTRMYYTEKPGSDTLVIFYHGNGGSACDRSHIAHHINALNVSFIFVEYGGYAGDTQTPSEKVIFQDVENVVAFSKTISPPRTVVIGESIGSGPSLYQTTIAPVDSLILISAFTRIDDVAAKHYPYFPVRLLMHDTYDNISRVANYKGDLILIHGKNDRIIPDTHSTSLFNASLSTSKELILIEKAGHNDISNYLETFNAITKGIRPKN